MAINNIMSVAQSALQAAQTQVQVTSNNISNVNTPGYSREVVNQQELVAAGAVGGVSVVGVQNVVNQFLQQASLKATAQSGQAQAMSTVLDQAQGLFGDPTSSNSFFSNLDNVYAAFSTASASPTSLLSRQSAVTSVATFLNSAQNVASSLTQLQSQANQQVGGDVTTVNGLLQQISKLNGSIAQVSLSGGNATGPQDQQNQLLTQLSSLIGVNIQSTPTGGVTVRSTDGVYLAGDLGPATVAFNLSGAAGVLTATPPNGGAQQINPGGGDIGGQMHLAQVDVPQMSAQLGEYVSQAVSQLNRASNAASATPALSTLTGQAMGMALPTAVSGFSGKTNIAIVNSSGVIQQQVAIDFSAGTMSVNGGAPTSFTPANFLTSLNTALAPNGSASFTNGALSLSAAGAGNGVAIADDSTTPSSNAGQGFSQFFGLNNLVASSSFTRFATGLNSADPNTFSGSVSLQLADASGAGVRQVNVTMPAGGTVAGVLSALNTGVGAYGTFSLGANGRLTFASNNITPVTVSVASDSTANSAGGPSLSQMFGIGDSAIAGLTNTYSVRSDIARNANNLPFASLNLSAAVGTSALLPGDGSGALAMAQSGASTVSFAATGGLPAAATTVSNYASQIAGVIAAKVSAADTLQQTAASTAAQASSQMGSATGVNLDQELVNLTTYQQAYSASARLVQAASTMMDSLLQMVP